MSYIRARFGSRLRRSSDHLCPQKLRRPRRLRSPRALQIDTCPGVPYYAAMNLLVRTTLVISIGVGFSMLGDIFLKQSGLSKIGFVFAGILLYACGAVPVAIAFNRIAFGAVFLVWEAVTVIVAMIVARLMFNEPMNTHRVVAVLCALAALYLSSR